MIILATVGAFGLGTVLAWTSPAIKSMRENSEEFRNVSDESESWVGSILAVCEKNL
jgi:hypothetical protein